MKNSIFILFVAFLTTSCHQNQSDHAGFIADEILTEEEIFPAIRQDLVAPPPPPLSPIETTKEVIKKKIIKDGRLGVEVQELERTKTHVDSLVERFEGYYASERLNNTEREISYNLKIRIPSHYFEKFIAQVEEGNGEIKYKEIDARDVTEEFIDLETRLANKKNYLKKYNELLTKAKTVKDILEIEDKIRKIEEEIESTTGRLEYLNDLIDYSTLHLEISKPKDFKYQPVKRDKFTNRFIHAIANGWFGFIDFIVFLVKIWPFWILMALTIYAWKKFRLRKKE
ncbi:DUF4349 domain-containing protein [Thermophagus sp. OGC60D27]|uniref:DUF4349 domain-containing protein n=1 Tax=Thermophagus sp. OGC60D27 TaxID=3458415 RepID=UPI0040381704